jgi:hypothetical protein
MQSIISALGFPSGTPIDTIEGRVGAVYDHTPLNTKFGPTTVQNATLEDIAGNKIKMSVWGHADLTPLRNMDVVITSAKDGKGVVVEHTSYKNKAGIEVSGVQLKISKYGQFQKVEVWKAQNGGNPSPSASQGPSTPSQDVKSPVIDAAGTVKGFLVSGTQQVVRGDKVGMSLKAAVDLVVHGVVKVEDDGLEATLHQTAAMLIKVSNELEQGK